MDKENAAFIALFAVWEVVCGDVITMTSFIFHRKERQEDQYEEQ